MLLAGGARGIRRVLLVGLGRATDRVSALRRAATLAARQAGKLGTGSLAFYGGVVSAAEAEAATVGLHGRRRWTVRKTSKTPPPEDERRAPVSEAVVLSASLPQGEVGVAAGRAIGEGHALARTLGMMPGNLCTPEFLAETARQIAARHGLTCTVLGANGDGARGHGLLLVRARKERRQDPKLIVLEYLRERREPNRSPSSARSVLRLRAAFPLSPRRRWNG